MTAFEFSASLDVRAYCEEILDAIVQLFAVSRDEALIRMNRHWRDQTMTSEDDLLSLRRELPDYWARRIYHGPDAKWWLAGGETPPHTDGGG
jgi:hypothetical protein